MITYCLTFWLQLYFISKPSLSQLDSTYRKKKKEVLFSHLFLNNLTRSQGGSVATLLAILLPPPNFADGRNPLIWGVKKVLLLCHCMYSRPLDGAKTNAAKPPRSCSLRDTKWHSNQLWDASKPNYSSGDKTPMTPSRWNGILWRSKADKTSVSI